MKKSRIIVIISMLLITILLISACSKSYDSVYPSPAPSSGGGADVTSQIVLNQSNRKVIYTVDIRLTTEDFNKTLADLYAAIEKDETAGNWIKAADITSNGNYQSAYITVKVKTTLLNDFIAELPDMGTVTSQKHNSEDITYNYATTEARISALTTERDYYQTLIENDTVVNNVSLMGQYIQKITAINTELALMNDQLVKYDNDLEYSTVNIDINAYTVIEEEEVAFWTSIKNVFIGSIKFLVSVVKGIIIVIVAVAPFAAIGGAGLLIGFFINKKIKEKKAKK